MSQVIEIGFSFVKMFYKAISYCTIIFNLLCNKLKISKYSLAEANQSDQNCIWLNPHNLHCAEVYNPHQQPHLQAQIISKCSSMQTENKLTEL